VRDVRFLHQDIRVSLFFRVTLLGLAVIRVTQILRVTLGVGVVMIVRVTQISRVTLCVGLR